MADDKTNGNGNGANKAAPEGTASDVTPVLTTAPGFLSQPKRDHGLHPAGNVGVQDRRRLGLPAATSDVQGDTGLHNAGNAGPIATGTERAARISQAPLPGGLGQSLTPHPERDYDVAPEPQDPGLVAHSGFSNGMSAHQEAAVSHLNMRLGEIRNVLRDFNVDYLPHGKKRDLVVQMKEILHVPSW